MLAHAIAVNVLATLVIWAALSLPVLARTVEVTATTDFLTLAPVVDYLEDPSGQLTLEDVESPSQTPRFRPASKDGPEINFSFSLSTYWLRFTIKPRPGIPRDWLLEIAYPLLDRIQVYVPDSAPMVSGDHLPFTARPIASRSFLFPVYLSGDGPQTVYVSVASQGALTIPMHLWRPQAFSQHSRDEYAFLGLYYGLLLSLLFHNIVKFIFVRDLASIFYVAMCISVGITMLSFNGLGSQYLWPDSAYWNDRSVLVCGSCSGLFAILFSRRFLATRQVAPGVDRLLRIQQILFALLVPVALLFPYHFVSKIITPALALLGFSIAGGSLRCLFLRQRSAYWFVFGWGLLMVGMVVTSLRIYGWLPVNPFTVHIVQIGSAMEMLLFSFALADKHREAKKLAAKALHEIEAAQAQQNFVAIFSHELRNPIASICALADNLIRLGASAPLNIVDKCQKIKEVVQRIDLLIESYLTDSQLKIGNFIPRMTAFDIRALITELIRQQYLPSQRVLLNNCDGDPLMMIGDPHLLYQAISNILDNAIKYSPADMSIEVSVTEIEKAAVIEIRDYGAGVYEKELDRIFEPFYRTGQRHDARGNGLGLWIVKRILDLHKGSIRARRNDDGNGTTFIATLPLTSVADL
ncbi:sensor histidine kinase [Cupriavidus sp. D39]|uniref:sensor histidine kinase n=1 Tax=Cupriavidus sp. D39 TaxID=2997877 RepID=UPI00226FB191|nr:sensor histidine kinase [Cupriavidus sp. D39]MCY0858774.1 sensor histidine kinase [Cupriavidus sp. D39]